jgi:hypothetical protein
MRICENCGNGEEFEKKVATGKEIDQDHCGGRLVPSDGELTRKSATVYELGGAVNW